MHTFVLVCARLLALSISLPSLSLYPLCRTSLALDSPCCDGAPSGAPATPRAAADEPARDQRIAIANDGGAALSVQLAS